MKKALLVLAFAGLATLPVLIYHYCNNSKIVYIDIQKVFGSFDMKKELQKKYKETESGRQKLVDSLSFRLQIISTKVRANQNDKELAYLFDAERENYFKQKKRIDEDNVALSNQYDKQILEQMSQYIMEYGKKQGYDFILGADGNGTLMFANEKYNISEQVITYINDKYNGIE